MDIDKLTIGEAKALAAMFAAPSQGFEVAAWPIGKPFMIRTVTHIITGRLLAVTANEFVLTDAAWIADTGRYAHAVASGSFNEVEPYPDGATVFVGRGALIDAVEINTLPREQK
jgi:hypothetical protein